MKKRVYLLVLLLTMVSYAQSVTLQSGWNLLGVNSSLSLEVLQNKVGIDNLQVIQGQNKTYQKSYEDEGKGFLNSFSAFEKGRGYWIKVNGAVDIEYDKTTYLTDESINLITGWNLINPPTDLNLSEVLSQLDDNLLVIQGQTKTYQKAYVDEGKSFLNSFENFKEPQGYWVKVATDTVLNFPVVPVAPTITGEALKTLTQYMTYDFLPEATDINGDDLIFSIENLPEWAEFNSSTGELSGQPHYMGTYNDIRISVTDGSQTVALAPFDIEVTPAFDIAHLFGSARQGTDSSYSYYAPASYVIDNNDSTFNHTRGGKNDENWVEVELPEATKIYKIVVQSRNSNTYRLDGAKVYILDQEYNGTVDESTAIETLKGISAEQTIILDRAMNGHYLLVKGKHDEGDNSHIHLIKVEVYGELPAVANYKVEFPKSNYSFGLEHNASIANVVGRVTALNYARKSLNYSIVGDVPFSIDADGRITVNASIDDNQIQKYVFEVEVTDGANRSRTEVEVNLLSINGVTQERWNNITGTSLWYLFNSDHYKSDVADERKIVNKLDMYGGGGDNFGQKMSAIFKPSTSGDYIFAVVGDDATQVDLSGVKIAFKSGWASYQNWESAGKSNAIRLNAGEIYPLVAYLKEGGGAEHISVAYRKVEDENFTLIPASELFIETLNANNIKPRFLSYTEQVELGSANGIGDKVVTVGAFDSQGDTLTYTLIGDVPFSIDTEGNIFVNGSLEVTTYNFEVEVSDGVNTIRTSIAVTSSTDTHSLNETKEIFETKAKAFTEQSSVDELTQSYVEYAHAKSKDIYTNFMPNALEDSVWDWIGADTYIKEGLYAARFPANPYFVKNLADFKQKLTEEDNVSLFDGYKNLFLGLAINAKERGVSQEAVFGDTSEHKTLDYANLVHYEEKERVWRDELVVKDLGYGIGYNDFKNYLYLKYNLSVSEEDALADTTILRNMAEAGVDIASADYDTRKEYGLSFDGLNLYRIVTGQSRADCQAMGNPCEQIQTWLDTNGTVTESEFLVHFSTYKSEVIGLINPLNNMNNELMEFMGVAPDKYNLMSFYDLAKWKISLDKIAPIDFNDAEPNWPIFNASMQYNSTQNAYPWQMMTLEQSAQKQECGYVKSRFFETDKDALRASYPPNAIDGGVGAEKRFKEYTTYTWAYNEPEVWFRASEWSPHRTVYRILQDGGVCGRQSTMGQHVNECLNRPSIGIGQPGHRAWVGVYNHATIDGQYYIRIGYQVGSKESASSGVNSIYDRYTQGIRDRGIERFGGVVTGVSPAGVGEHVFNQSMILQHIGKILENGGENPEAVLRKAIEIAPTNVDAWYQLARYYTSKDEAQKVLDLANEFMAKRNTFFLDDDGIRGGENLEVIVGKVIAFIALEAPSIKEGRGDDALALKDKLWEYLDTYEKDYRSYRSYGYQNRYLAQLYLLGQEDNEGFVTEVENLFDRFLENTTSGTYAYNYFQNVYWGDVNKTALFDTLQDKTDLADISDSQRAKIYEKILDRGQGLELADVVVNDICVEGNLSTCQSLKQFELDASEVYLTTISNVVGEDTEVDPLKQGVDAYSTLVIPVVDDLGAEQDIKVRIAKLATADVDGKLLKINDPTAVSTEKTQIVMWIDSSDNQLEANRIYSSSSRVVLRTKKRVENNEEYMGDVIINIQDLIQGHGVTFTGEDLLSQTYQDDDTAFYFTTLNANIGPTTGVWWSGGESTLLVPVKDDNGTVTNMKLKASNKESYLMNSAMSAGWQYALTLSYDVEDNPTLESGKHYTTVMPFTIDARMWHKERRVNDRMYVEVDMVVE